MIKFATYLYPHTCYTSKSSNLIYFTGYSFPHYRKVREKLEKALTDYPSLPVRKVELSEYLRVHTDAYLEKLLLMVKVSCPVLSSHGGGYRLPVTLSAAVSHVEVLASYH
jgi:acetoin utilization deacetylase AcuC-like enzyme